MKKKELLEKIYEDMKSLNHEQVVTLLNIHSMYITNDNEEVPFSNGMTVEKWVRQRIEKTTYEEDFQTVIKLIRMIKCDTSFNELENFCESLHYNIRIK